MKKNINTILLVLANLLLVANLYVSYSHPTTEDVEKVVRKWGQHYGLHFSKQ